MKNTKQTNIIIVLGVLLIISISLFPGYYAVQQVKAYPLYDTAYHTTNPSPLYETDGHIYENGEILLPDYVHVDTLMVIDADLINSKIHGPDVASDGDIAEILYQGCWTLDDIKDEFYSKAAKKMMDSYKDEIAMRRRLFK